MEKRESTQGRGVSNLSAGLILMAATVSLAACGSSKASESGHGPAREEGHQEATEAHDRIRLPPEKLAEFGVKFAVAGPGRLEETLQLPGEVVLDPARVVHVVPRVSGVVQKVSVRLGDEVRKGQLLAVLSSRELADLAADYMAARAEAALAREEFRREERLLAKGVTSEREFAKARAALRKAYVRVESAKSRLSAIGLSRRDVRALLKRPSFRMSRYELRAPMDGVVVRMHITRGERVSEEHQVFTIADVSRVWVEVKVYQRDLHRVRPGQRVVVEAKYGKLRAEGRIEYVSPLLGTATRTATARVVLDNERRRWRPGLFAVVRVVTGAVEVPVLVPRSAILEVEGRTCIFVQEESGLVCRSVEVGRSNERTVEVRRGLNPGDRYVSEGGFTLKAELSKAAFGEGHEH